MNKNIIIKSIAALTILTSITGVGTTVVDGIQQTAKAENQCEINYQHECCTIQWCYMDGRWNRICSWESYNHYQ